jgi:hypothetical protein
MKLMEKIKANGYEGKYDMVMNLAQAMLQCCMDTDLELL